jgi:hypothetical protein
MLFTAARYGSQNLGPGGQMKRKEIICDPGYK